MVELSNSSQISGFLTLIAIIILIPLLIIVLKRAIETKEKILYLFFFTFIFSFSPWYPTGFGYIYWIFTHETLSYDFNILAGMAFTPIGIIAWINIYLRTVKPNFRTSIIIVFTIFSCIFEVYLFYYLYFAPGAPIKSLLGTVNELRTNFLGFILIYALISVIIVCSFGIHFSIISIKEATSNKIRWKGKFLLAGFSFFTIVLILDTILPSSLIIGIIIIRIMLIFTCFFLYLGFILPNWIKKLLKIKE